MNFLTSVPFCKCLCFWRLMQTYFCFLFFKGRLWPHGMWGVNLQVEDSVWMTFFVLMICLICTCWGKFFLLKLWLLFLELHRRSAIVNYAVKLSHLFFFWIISFQEIVPLNAGNVLVIEDNEPAAKWLSLIDQSLNRPSNISYCGWKPTATLSGSLFFPKPSLKRISKIFRVENGRRLKACNCFMDLERKNSKDLCFRCQPSNVSEDDISSDDEEDEEPNGLEISEISTSFSVSSQRKYSLVASKQMVGIFVCVWMRTELVQHVGHLRISCISRGIMGCLGNKVTYFIFFPLGLDSPKCLLRHEISSSCCNNQGCFLISWILFQGCISVSMSFYQTSFCFICSHLASGEKEGDELRRNLDVIEIIKNTQFRKICRSPQSRMPMKILGHE